MWVDERGVRIQRRQCERLRRQLHTRVEWRERRWPVSPEIIRPRWVLPWIDRLPRKLHLPRRRLVERGPDDLLGRDLEGLGEGGRLRACTRSATGNADENHA